MVSPSLYLFIYLFLSFFLSLYLYLLPNPATEQPLEQSYKLNVSNLLFNKVCNCENVIYLSISSFPSFSLYIFISFLTLILSSHYSSPTNLIYQIYCLTGFENVKTCVYFINQNLGKSQADTICRVNLQIFLILDLLESDLIQP